MANGEVCSVILATIGYNLGLGYNFSLRFCDLLCCMHKMHIAINLNSIFQIRKLFKYETLPEAGCNKLTYRTHKTWLTTSNN